MSRVLFVALFVATAGCSGCGNGSKSPADQQKPSPGETGAVIAVPGAKGGPVAGAPGVSGASDPRFHLTPEEGSITVGKAEGNVGAEATAKLALAPAAGYHVATDYPIKLTLEPPPGVTLAKTELSAGGRNKEQGDAAELTEQALAFAIKATAEKAGAYEIKGVFKFGICEKDSCHPKKQPITITVAAK